MSINFIVRRTGNSADSRLTPLRKEGTAILKKHGAVSHKFGSYRSGPYAGQIIIVLTYPDHTTYDRAMKGMSEDPDWKRIADEIEKLSPLQETYLTDTEDQ
jgi:hypothetical protein